VLKAVSKIGRGDTSNSYSTTIHSLYTVARLSIENLMSCDSLD